MIIIQDSSEQQPFDFTFFDNVDDVIVKRLKTGDYTLEGFEGILSIERKASVDEIANNFGTKKSNWWKEMERMASMRYKYIVCEFPLDHVTSYPKHSNVPNKKRIKMSSLVLSDAINKCVANYGIEIFFCDGKQAAEEKAYQILTEVYAKGKEEEF